MNYLILTVENVGLAQRECNMSDIDIFFNNVMVRAAYVDMVILDTDCTRIYYRLKRPNSCGPYEVSVSGPLLTEDIEKLENLCRNHNIEVKCGY